MTMRHTALFLIASAILPAAAFAQAETTSAEAPPAPEYRRSSLLERGPFARPERGRAPVATSGPIELRGFFGEGANLEVSLTRPDTHESAWVKVGDVAAKWLVESADPDEGTADVKFDGMRLHLKLAKAGETGDAQPSASPAVVQVVEQVKPQQPRKVGFGSMSEEGRNAMRNAMQQTREAARKEHPEFYDRSKPLTADQEKAKAEYEAANWAKVRAEVSKVSEEDAAHLAEAPMGRGERGERGARQGGGQGGGQGARQGGGRSGRSGRNSGGDGVGLRIGNSAPASSEAPSR